VLGLFHAVLVFRLLFHAASALPLDCAVDAASALPRSDRVVQPWSFAAVSAMARPWYRAPARSFSLGCRCASSRTVVLTDLLANPEPGKVNRLLLLLLKSRARDEQGRFVKAETPKPAEPQATAPYENAADLRFLGGTNPIGNGAAPRRGARSTACRWYPNPEEGVWTPAQAQCFNNLLRPMLHLNQTMLSWEPERIIFAHGPWHDANGTTELRNAFRWLLK
jgi:hypothetical protein